MIVWDIETSKKNISKSLKKNPARPCDIDENKIL